jgi:tryptophanase
MDYVAAAVKNVFEKRNDITKGYKIKREPEILRHFTVQLDKA